MDSEINEAYKKAPPELQAYLASSDFTESVDSLVSSFAIDQDRVSVIKNAYILVILGVAESEELTESFVETLGFTEEMSANLAQKIDDTVFTAIQQILETGSENEVKELKIPTEGTETKESLRESMTDTQKKAPPIPAVQGPSTIMGSRTMLMDQLALIGQIPKDEDVLARLNRIKEQLRKGEEEREKVDKEIADRTIQEKLNRVEHPKHSVPRKVYDIDPYREEVGEEELSL